MNLSENAKDALYNVGTSRQGARVSAAPIVLGELMRHCLIGNEQGLTRKGTITRDRIAAAKLDAAF